MEWIRGSTLGQGSFGTVSLAIAKPSSKDSDSPQLLAVKSCSASCSASLLNEKIILDQFQDCPEIIQCYGDSYTYEHGEKLYNLFLEYASGGALVDKIKNFSNHRLPEDEVRGYIKGIVRGLNCIHGKGIVHCDIKLQNILLHQDGSIKIADFGLAKKAVDEKEQKLGFELRGTPMYMSPEMVAGGDQGSAADIWALGCLMAEMLTGAPAWGCSDVTDLLMRIGNTSEMPEIPAKLSDEGKDFIRNCFIRDPKKRWTAEMLLNHPFLNYDDHSKNCEIPSVSPRSAFDFPDWISLQSSHSSSAGSISSPERLENSGSWFSGDSNSCPESPAGRLRRLVNDQQQNDWLVSGDWVTVR